MKHRVFFVLAICWMGMTSWLPAQNFPGLPPVSDTATFEEIRRTQNDYWKDKHPGPGTGYKVFRRWEHFWETRLMPDGSFPPSDITAKELEKFKKSQEQKGHAQQTESQSVSNWVSLGPNSNAGGNLGRVNCMVVSPLNPNWLYAGTAGGGLWFSANGGAWWRSMTDQLPNLGVTAVAISPASPQRVFIATGDAFGAFFPSVGVYASPDGGNNWTQTGLHFDPSQQEYIRQLVIRPDSANILWATTNRGLYRTRDGGNTWSRVLSMSCWDMRFQPNNPQTAYVATTNSILRTTNGGGTWTTVAVLSNLASPQPPQPSTRIALAVTPASPNLVMALASNASNNFYGLFASTNAGASFAQRFGTGPGINLLNRDSLGVNTIQGQGNYDLALTISPVNANLVYIGAVNLWRSVNGGNNWNLASYWTAARPSGRGAFNLPVVHADIHNFCWQPNGNLLECTDGGAFRTDNGGTSWTFISNSMAISQLYRIGTLATGGKTLFGAQDIGTKLLENNLWRDVIGGDGGECAVHPTNPNILYGESQWGDLRRSADNGNTWTNLRQNIPGRPTGAFITPFQLSPLNPNTLYAGYDSVFRSDNQGTTWTVISPSLGGAERLRCLTVAPNNPNVIYVSNRTNIWRTANGGGLWSSIRGTLPINGNIFVHAITVDPSNANRLFVALTGYSTGNKVFQSNDGGTTWINISGNLPNLPAFSLVFEPGSFDALYAGMDAGVYYRNAAMSNWVPFNFGLPNAPVHELEIQATAGTIRAATLGRGLWESNLQAPGVFAVAPAQVSLPASSSVIQRINVTAYAPWTVVSNQSWLFVSPPVTPGSVAQAGLPNTFDGWSDISVSPNTGSASRTGMITFVSAGIIKTVSVTQAGTATTTSTCSNDSEFGVNDYMSRAPEISLGVAKESIIATSQDKDYWRLQLPVRADLTVRLSNLPANYDLRVYNGAGTLLGQSANGGSTDELLTLSNQPVGTYYLLVSAAAGAYHASICYLLSATATPQSNCANDNEPGNNQTSAATFLILGTGHSSLLAANGDEDFYRLDLTQTTDVSLSLFNLPADYDVELLEATGNRRGSYLGGTNPEYIRATLAAGTHYVRVFAQPGVFSPTQCYSLLVAPTPPDDICTNGFEPLNNQPFYPAAIPVGVELRSQLSQNTDQDCWRFTLGTATNAMVSLRRFNADMELRVLNAQLQALGASSNAADTEESIYLANLPAGDYYVMVYSAGAFSIPQCYTLLVHAVPAFCSDDSEPANNSLSNAPFIPTGIVKTSSLTTNDDFDIWTFTVPAYPSYTVASFPNTNGFVVEIRDLLGNSLGRGQQLNVTLNTGRYWAIVSRSTSAGAGGCYQLLIKVGAPGYCANDSEPSNNQVSLYTPEIQPGVVKRSIIGSSTDRDWWKFTLSATTTITATLRDLPANYDQDYWKFTLAATSVVKVELYPPLLPSLPCHFDLSGPGTAFTPPASNAYKYIENVLPAGTYFIRVYNPVNQNFTTQDCYRLKVTANPLPACVNGNEPANNNTVNPPSVAMNTYTYSRLGTAGDIDIWKFSVFAHSNIQAELFNLPADFDVHLLDHFGNGIAESFKSGTQPELVRVVLNPGTYYVAVVGKNNVYHPGLCYTLKLSDGQWGQFQALDAHDRSVEEPAFAWENADAEPDAEEKAVRVFPNPTTGRFYIVLPEEGRYQLSLFNALGTLVSSWESSSPSSEFDLRGQAQGVYFLNVRQEGRSLGRQAIMYQE